MGWEQRNADFCKAQTDAQMAYIEAEREVDQLQDENTKLVMKLNAEHLVRQNVEVENAKLRELVEDMYNEIDAATQYDAGGGRGVVYELADRMRKLGVMCE